MIELNSKLLINILNGEKMKTLKKFWLKIYPKPRPYWFVDAKWIFGILFFLCFTSTLWLYSFTQVISKNNIVDTITTEVQDMLKKKVENFKIEIDIKSGENLKNQLIQAKDFMESAAQETNQAQDQMQSDKKEFIQPIPGVNFKIEKNQIQKYTREAEIWAYNEIAKSLDETKISALISSVEAIEKVLPETKDFNLKEEIISSIKTKIIENIKIPKVYSEQTYQKYHKIYSILLVISIFLALGVVFFSYRFGRIFNPGLLVLLSAGPGAYIFNTVYRYLKETPLNRLARSKIEIVSELGNIIIRAKDKQTLALYSIHKNVLIIGIVLVSLAIIGKIVYEIYIRRILPAKKHKKVKK